MHYIESSCHASSPLTMKAARNTLEMQERNPLKKRDAVSSIITFNQLPTVARRTRVMLTMCALGYGMRAGSQSGHILDSRMLRAVICPRIVIHLISVCCQLTIPRGADRMVLHYFSDWLCTTMASNSPCKGIGMTFPSCFMISSEFSTERVH